MANALNLTGYKLTFDDEFDTLSVSQNGTGTTWRDIRPGSRLGPNSDIGFGTSAFLDAGSGYDPFSLQDGALDITAIPVTPALKSAVGPGTWASGLISSQGTFSQEYGYFEMRAEMPAGIGAWPAFWMGAADGSWPPELDVVEWYADNPKNAVQTVHSSVSGQDAYTQTWDFGATDLAQGFHTYGVLWDPQHITFYVDGIEVGQQDTPADMDTPMYLMADLAMTTGEQGTMTTSPQTMKIDYIRAFSDAAGAKAVALQPVSSPDGTDTSNLYGAVAASTAPAAQNTLVLQLSEDAWKGNAQFTVSVDGKPVGGTQLVSALHDAGASQDFALVGDWGTGIQQVAVSFINDAYGGTPQTDRNLYVDAISYDGQSDAGTDATLLGNGTRVFAVGGGTAAVAAASDTLLLQLSEDAWQGDAQFTVSIDGRLITAPDVVTALHKLGKVEDFEFSGNFGAGRHTVGVSFINDAYGGTPQTDRNLYVNSVRFDGMPVSSGVTTLLSNGTATFTVVAPHG